MVKKGALSGAIISLIGGGIYAYTLMLAATSDYLSAATFIYYTSFEHFGLPALGLIIYILGMAVFFFAGIGTKKKSIIIGGIITAIGLIGSGIMILMGSGGSESSFTIMIFSIPYQIFIIILLIGTIAYYVGLIKNRKRFKLGLVSGLFMVLTTIALMIFDVAIIPGNVLTRLSLYNLSSSQEKMVEIEFVVQAVVIITFILNAFLFSFCKIGEGYSEEEEELSVEKGDAFASYVDEDAGYTPSKKTGGGDDVIFEF